jgi:hypothetical protein
MNSYRFDLSVGEMEVIENKGEVEISAAYI